MFLVRGRPWEAFVPKGLGEQVRVDWFSSLVPLVRENLDLMS